MASTRSITRDTGAFTRATAGSQSLARGLRLLRAFRPGVGTLTNADLALRSGLPRSTISRLTRVMVDEGFLSYDIAARGYRLSAVYLGLSNVYRYEIPMVDAALPLMKSIAEGEKINVGLAIGEHSEMMYLESVRESRRGVFRRAGPGTRFPMELTASGRAYLAAISPTKRAKLLCEFAHIHVAAWPEIQRGITQAKEEIQRHGYCAVQWQPGLTALATCLVAPDGQVYSVSIGLHHVLGHDPSSLERYGSLLLLLQKNLGEAWRFLS